MFWGLQWNLGCNLTTLPSAYLVPNEVGEPVRETADASHDLNLLRIGDTLDEREDDEESSEDSKRKWERHAVNPDGCRNGVCRVCLLKECTKLKKISKIFNRKMLATPSHRIGLAKRMGGHFDFVALAEEEA